LPSGKETNVMKLADLFDLIAKRIPEDLQPFQENNKPEDIAEAFNIEVGHFRALDSITNQANKIKRYAEQLMWLANLNTRSFLNFKPSKRELLSVVIDETKSATNATNKQVEVLEEVSQEQSVFDAKSLEVDKVVKEKFASVLEEISDFSLENLRSSNPYTEKETNNCYLLTCNYFRKYQDVLLAYAAYTEEEDIKQKFSLLHQAIVANDEQRVLRLAKLVFCSDDNYFVLQLDIINTLLEAEQICPPASPLHNLIQEILSEIEKPNQKFWSFYEQYEPQTGQEKKLAQDNQVLTNYSSKLEQENEALRQKLETSQRKNQRLIDNNQKLIEKNLELELPADDRLQKKKEEYTEHEVKREEEIQRLKHELAQAKKELEQTKQGSQPEQGAITSQTTGAIASINTSRLFKPISNVGLEAYNSQIEILEQRNQQLEQTLSDTSFQDYQAKFRSCLDKIAKAYTPSHKAKRVADPCADRLIAKIKGLKEDKRPVSQRVFELTILLQQDNGKNSSERKKASIQRLKKFTAESAQETGKQNSILGLSMALLKSELDNMVIELTAKLKAYDNPDIWTKIGRFFRHGGKVAHSPTRIAQAGKVSEALNNYILGIEDYTKDTLATTWQGLIKDYQSLKVIIEVGSALEAEGENSYINHGKRADLYQMLQPYKVRLEQRAKIISKLERSAPSPQDTNPTISVPSQ
jgi:hypothetical protein